MSDVRAPECKQGQCYVMLPDGLHQLSLQQRILVATKPAITLWAGRALRWAAAIRHETDAASIVAVCRPLPYVSIGGGASEPQICDGLHVVRASSRVARAARNVRAVGQGRPAVEHRPIVILMVEVSQAALVSAASRCVVGSRHAHIPLPEDCRFVANRGEFRCDTSHVAWNSSITRIRVLLVAGSRIGPQGRHVRWSTAALERGT
mmetsp:Transcript_69746/g.138277  ORF Transcript_69746/g.138277 Transcript_69746/m.138277 type:complete len:206 (-) Transcript_69746:388-1005(-)